MYRSEEFSSEQTKGLILAYSPLDAMQMAEASGPCELFPTVTITLTTIFWPGTAH